MTEIGVILLRGGVRAGEIAIPGTDNTAPLAWVEGGMVRRGHSRQMQMGLQRELIGRDVRAS